ncbi:MAG: 50S ribosome-binding GTPase [Kiritimatiellae bacterium]|nr:50S ribosome-binding GTPase [Kiritimatiellia bacterium]
MKSPENRLRVAIVGDFAIGKSSLANCLLAETIAETGEGLFPTTEAAAEFPFMSGVLLVDTPGFDDVRQEMTREAEEEIAKADVVLFVKTETKIGDRDVGTLKMAGGKPLILLFNCTNKTLGMHGWVPELRENAETCTKIRRCLEDEGLASSLLPAGGMKVAPLNILWAQFGLGLVLSDEQRNAVVDFAHRKLGIATTDDALRAEMLRRSGFLPVRDFLKNLPLELLKDAAAHPEREIDRIVNRFAEELKKRWNAA